VTEGGKGSTFLNGGCCLVGGGHFPSGVLWMGSCLFSWGSCVRGSRQFKDSYCNAWDVSKDSATMVSTVLMDLIDCGNRTAIIGGLGCLDY
jgi:hypothetical protein